MVNNRNSLPRRGQKRQAVPLDVKPAQGKQKFALVGVLQNSPQLIQMSQQQSLQKFALISQTQGNVSATGDRKDWTETPRLDRHLDKGFTALKEYLVRPSRWPNALRAQPEITVDYPGNGRSRQQRDNKARTANTEKLNALQAGIAILEAETLDCHLGMLNKS